MKGGARILMLSLLALPATGQNGIRWQPDLATARERAREDNLPMLLVLVGKTPLDLDVVRSTHRDPRLYEALRPLICVLADRTRHHQARGLCGRHRGIDCQAHQRAWTDAAAAFRFLSRDGKGNVRTPQYVFLGPPGDPISRWGGKLDLSRFESEVELALRTTGKGATDRKPDDLRLRRLTRQLRSRKSAEQLIATQELVRLQLIEARRLLFRLTRDNKNSKRQLRAIETIPMRGSLDALGVLQGFLDHRRPDIRNAAVRGLGELRHSASVDLLLAFARERCQPEHQLEVPRALALAGPHDPRTVRWLVRTIDDAHGPLQSAAMRSLLEIYRPAKKLVASLRGQLDSRNTDQRDTAAFVLRELEKRGQLPPQKSFRIAAR